MRFDNDGFQEITIPAQHIKTCSGCKFYKYRLIKSGNNPIYADYCEHDDAPNKLYMSGNIPDIKIQGYVLTPDWCPFNKK